MLFLLKMVTLPFLSRNFKFSKMMVDFGFKHESEFLENYQSGGNEFRWKLDSRLDSSPIWSKSKPKPISGDISESTTPTHTHILTPLILPFSYTFNSSHSKPNPNSFLLTFNLYNHHHQTSLIAPTTFQAFTKGFQVFSKLYKSTFSLYFVQIQKWSMGLAFDLVLVDFE